MSADPLVPERPPSFPGHLADPLPGDPVATRDRRQIHPAVAVDPQVKAQHLAALPGKPACHADRPVGGILDVRLVRRLAPDHASLLLRHGRLDRVQQAVHRLLGPHPETVRRRLELGQGEHA
jgi:hypothetical protein